MSEDTTWYKIKLDMRNGSGVDLPGMSQTHADGVMQDIKDGKALDIYAPNGRVVIPAGWIVTATMTKDRTTGK